MYSKKTWFFARIAAALLLLIVLTSNTSAQGITIRKPLKIVHLGDSFSAGNSARSTSGERNYYGVEGCLRSPTNWGNQYADSLQATYSATYINRACSGAVINDVIDRDDSANEDHGQKMGEVDKVNGNCPTPKYPTEEYYVDTSTNKCTRYLKNQIDAIDESVDLVLMTLGGNDLHFDEIVTDCYSILRTPGGCREDVKWAKTQLTDGILRADLLLAFKQIKARLRPGAKIVYLPYPYLALDQPYMLEYRDVTFGVVLDSYDARKGIKELSDLGHAEQLAAVNQANEDAGEDYIVFDFSPTSGTKQLFAGHEPDPSLIFQNPQRWIKEFEGNLLSTIDRKEMYHPNPNGHYNWASALSARDSFGVVGSIETNNADIDLAFVVDTTGSMGDDIAQVKTSMASLVEQLETTTDSYRVAVISYRDFPERTGASYDYPSAVIQTFTSDPVLIQAAIDSLSLGYGGDTPETVFSGIQSAIELPWRPGVTKITIVIGDAPALSPEPYTNLTAEQLIANSLLIDPVQVMGIDTYGLNSNGAIGQIAEGTGGFISSTTTEIAEKIGEIIEQTANQPFAWVGTGYSGKIGEPVVFDGSGSYDPSGLPIALYEWDFDGDGVYDFQSDTPTASHVYELAYDGLIVLRVTSAGGSSLASAPVVVNELGYVAPTDMGPCELDSEGYSIVVGEDGIYLSCIADHLPETGREGVGEVYWIYLPSVNR